MAIFNCGYGCYLDDVKYRLDYGERLIEALPQKLRKEFEEIYAECKDEYSGKQEFMTDCFATGECDISLDEILAAIGNAKYFGERNVLRGEELTLYAPLKFPKTEKQRDLIPLLPEVKNAISSVIDIVASNSKNIEMGYYLFEEL